MGDGGTRGAGRRSWARRALLAAACALLACLALAGGSEALGASWWEAHGLGREAVAHGADWWGRTGLDEGTVTEISVALSAPESYDEGSAWDASEALDGSVVACQDADGEVTIWPAKKGARVVAPADASSLFMGFVLKGGLLRFVTVDDRKQRFRR